MSENQLIDKELDAALDDLGLLSTITNSRKTYLHEQDVFFSNFEALSVMEPLASSDAASPQLQLDSCLPSTSAVATASFLQTPNNASNSAGFTFCSPSSLEMKNISNVGCKEKENNIFAGFRVLTMNSKFLTSFTNDYSLPKHVHDSMPQESERINKWYNPMYLRSMVRRKRTRTHPYLNSGGSACKESKCHALNEMSNNESEVLPPEEASCYRLRTTSLSSGVCGGKVGRRWRQQTVPTLESKKLGNCEKNSTGCCDAGDDASFSSALLVRSRSMEDLSAAEGEETVGSEMKALVASIIRKKEVENVSRAIQQMCVQDSG